MVPNSDLQRWQQAIQGIEAAQSDFSPDELSAFKALVEFYKNGYFESDESGGNIQIIKNALKQHVKNRLLKAHLTNFVTLCEKYFKIQTKPVVAPASGTGIPPLIQPSVKAGVAAVPVIDPPRIIPPAFEPPTVQLPVDVTVLPPKPQSEIPVITPAQEVAPEPKVEIPVFGPPVAPESSQLKGNNTTTKEGKNNTKLILFIAAIAVLIGGWWIYDNRESGSVRKVLDKFGFAPPDTVRIVTDDAKKTADEKTSTTQEEQKNHPPTPYTKTYSFGKYSGQLKNGMPEGNGTMIYTKPAQIAKHAREPYYAEKGDVFVGTWGNGDIVNGKLFDKNNNLKATILAGKRPNPYDINKD